MILRDLGALAAARRSDQSLDSERAQQAANAAAKHPPADKKADVTTGLEALRAVLPATFITLYSTAVLLLQKYSQSEGAPGRAAEQAALATTFVKNPDALKNALQALSVETPEFLWARILMAALATAALAFQAYHKAQIPRAKKRVILEPVVTTLAFVAWALGAPGTFVAVYLNASELLVTTVVIVFGSALALWALSQTVLKKKSAS